MSTLEVRVKGRAIDTYNHEGKTWIEGRKGSKYTIHFKNNSYQRKKIVVSVDGLNVMTGDDTWQRGYVVGPWESIDIPGWRHDSEKVSEFYFSSLKGSYNQQNADGKKKNIGVIGCMVFNEKVKPQPAIVNHYHYDVRPWYPSTPWYWGSGVGNISYTSGQMPLQNSSQTLNVKDDGYEVFTSSMFVSDASAKASSNVMRSFNAAKPNSTIGTGYGKKVEFQTTTVEFNAEDRASETLLLYYDNKEGLMNRGVILRRKKSYRENQREAFPGFNNDGCPSPKHYKERGWEWDE